MNRRTLLVFALRLAPALGLGAALTTPVFAAQRKSLADPMRLGVEKTLIDSGLAVHLQRSFGRDTGVAVQLVPGNSAELLIALERGEIDATLTDAPELELKLEKQGLAHGRLQVAAGDLVLVGPVQGKGKKATDPAGVLREPDIAVALQRLSASASPVIGAPFGSGTYLAELSLWRAAKLAPAAPWYAKTDAAGDALTKAAAVNAYTLVERGVWLARGNKALAIVVEGDPRMAVPVHVMRSFRVSHPAGKLFTQWITGPQGRHAASGTRGWHAPPAH